MKILVASRTEAWIEICIAPWRSVCTWRSLPARKRGLKLVEITMCCAPWGRFPHGSVD